MGRAVNIAELHFSPKMQLKYILKNGNFRRGFTGAMLPTLWEEAHTGIWAAGGESLGRFGRISSNGLGVWSCRIGWSRASAPSFRLIKTVLSG